MKVNLVCHSVWTKEEIEKTINTLIKSNKTFYPMILPPSIDCHMTYYKEIPIRHWDGRFEICSTN